MMAFAEDPVTAALPRLHRVTTARRESTDTVTLELTAIDGRPARFAPGQFAMLYVFGVGEIPVSISGDPDDARDVAHTVRGVGAVSQALTRCRRGDVVGVRGPFGTSWPLEAAEGGDVVVVAGGIGLAPLRPVVLHVVAHRSLFGRVSVLVGSRSPTQLLFERDLHAWRSRFDLHVGVTVDHADTGWRGRVGLVTDLFDRAPFDASTSTAFVCGPEVMMRHTAIALVDAGVDPGHIHVSLERNMRCGLAQCGHCQLGPLVVCRDGPVMPWTTVAPLLAVREL